MLSNKKGQNLTNQVWKLKLAKALHEIFEPEKDHNYRYHLLLNRIMKYPLEDQYEYIDNRERKSPCNTTKSPILSETAVTACIFLCSMLACTGHPRHVLGEQEAGRWDSHGDCGSSDPADAHRRQGCGGRRPRTQGPARNIVSKFLLIHHCY